jgi:hypothetical protein
LIVIDTFVVAVGLAQKVVGITATTAIIKTLTLFRQAIEIVSLKSSPTMSNNFWQAAFISIEIS